LVNQTLFENMCMKTEIAMQEYILSRKRGGQGRISNVYFINGKVI